MSITLLGRETFSRASDESPKKRGRAHARPCEHGGRYEDTERNGELLNLAGRGVKQFVRT